ILLGRRAVLGHLGDHGALSLGHADRLSDVVAHILDHDAKPAAIDTAMLLQLPDYLLDKWRWHRESNADTAAGGRQDRGIHADDLAIKIECWAARVAAIYRRIDLQVIVGARTDVAVTRRDDTTSHRATEAKRIANGQHPVAYARFFLGKLQ